ncbi:MAG: hypothetical protein WC989_09495 [Micavibrio sp.]
MAKEMVKDAANTLSREIDGAKSRANTNIIKEDLQVLKEDAEVVLQDAKVLGRDLKHEGKKQLAHAEARAKEALDGAKERSRDQFELIAEYVRNNPGQSIAMAFVGGVVASMLVGRR